MSPTGRPIDEPMDRIDELLIDEVLWGLDADEQAELEQLSTSTPIDAARSSSYEITAAAACLPMLAARVEPAPESLRKSLESLAAHNVLERRGLTLVDLEHLGTDGSSSNPSPTPSVSAPESNTKLSQPGPRPWFSHLVAVAAVIMCLFLLWSRNEAVESVDMLIAKLQRAEDRKEIPWSQEGLRGDVVWSNELQRGVMVFEGLKANDPAVERYQLWVFDSKRDAARPVDGGLFDIGSDGKARIPFSPTLEIGDALGFAVTVEKPEGVVVSERHQIVATAGL